MKILIPENKIEELVFKYLDRTLGDLRRMDEEDGDPRIMYDDYLLFPYSGTPPYGTLYYYNPFLTSVRVMFGLDEDTAKFYIKKWFESRNNATVADMF